MIRRDKISEEIYAIYGDPISLGGSRWTNRRSTWLEQPITRMVSSSLSLTRRKRDIGAAASRRPNVRLIWCGNDQIMELGSDLGYRNSDRSFTYARLNLTPLDLDLPM